MCCVFFSFLSFFLSYGDASAARTRSGRRFGPESSRAPRLPLPSSCVCACEMSTCAVSAVSGVHGYCVCCVCMSCLYAFRCVCVGPTVRHQEKEGIERETGWER